MKKTYSKPQIMFEDFTLCTNIAAGCTYTEDIEPSEKEFGCGVRVGDGENEIIFVDGMCWFTTDDGSYNKICYYNPNSSGINIFTS